MVGRRVVPATSGQCSSPGRIDASLRNPGGRFSDVFLEGALLSVSLRSRPLINGDCRRRKCRDIVLLCPQTLYDYITRRRAVAAAAIPIIPHHRRVARRIRRESRGL